MSSKTISAILWTLVSVNVVTLVVGGLVTWLGYSIPVRLKQIGLLPELVITAGFASLVVACIGLGALNYSSYQTLNLYGMLCTIFALLLIFGIPENWYKSNQFAHTLLLDIIYFVLLFILVILLGFAFTFAHYLRKKELEIELFESGNNNNQVNFNLQLNPRTDLRDQSIQATQSSSKEQQQQTNSSNSNNNNCTCQSLLFNAIENADNNDANSANNNNRNSSLNVDKWFPNLVADPSSTSLALGETSSQQLFQSNNVGQTNMSNKVSAANNQHHTYNSNYHSSNFRTPSANFANFESNTFDAHHQPLSTNARRRNTQPTNLAALSTSNLNYQQHLQQQLQLQPLVLSDIGNSIKDDDRQLLLDSCSFLATQELVHKGYYHKDDRNSVNSPMLVRARSCTRMPNGIIDDEDEGDDDDDDNDVELGANRNETALNAGNSQDEDYDQEEHGDNCCNPTILSNFNNATGDKNNRALAIRQRPWRTLNSSSLLNNHHHYHGLSRDDSSIHYTNSRKRKQLIEEQLFCPRARHHSNRLHQHYHHHHHHRHNQNKQLHQQQLYSEQQQQQRHFHRINPKIHSQSSSHPQFSSSHTSNQNRLSFPFPSHLYQSATMARQAICRCNQLLKTPSPTFNAPSYTYTSTSAPITTETSTAARAVAELTAAPETTTTTCSTVEQRLNSVHSNQSKHLKANPSLPYTTPILLNNSTNSFSVKSNKSKSIPKANEAPSTSGAGSSSVMAVTATTALSTIGLSDPNSSSSIMTTTKSSGGNGMVDDGQSFGRRNSANLDHSNIQTTDNYHPNFDDIVANNISMTKDTNHKSIINNYPHPLF